MARKIVEKRRIRIDTKRFLENSQLFGIFIDVNFLLCDGKGGRYALHLGALQNIYAALITLNESKKIISQVSVASHNY